MKTVQPKLADKPRYEILDGLRGVAAITVMIFHCFESYRPPGGQQHFNHGYLAVDFFFVLSGFVVGYAYNDRWGKMSVIDFFKRRIVRLHPMVIAGAVLGLLLLFPGSETFPLVWESPWWKIALCFLMCMFLIPCGPGIDIRGWQDFFPLNCPSWTLAYEYFANILYALVLRHLPKAVLAVICLCCAFFTLDLTMGWDVFGLFPDGPLYTVEGGWYLTSQHVYIGFSRLLYPFFCGLLISRCLGARSSSTNPSGSPIHLKYGFLWTSLILFAILVMPCIGGRTGLPNGIFVAVAVIFLFPMLVIAGAGSVVETRIGTAVCKWLADLSYPLYITHYTLVYIQYSFALCHPDAPLWAHLAVSTGVIVASIAVARFISRVYDVPVRKWLADHWLKK